MLAAARELFVEGGSAATSVGDIARTAEVSVDTVYAAVGRKPQILLTVVDMVLASSARPLPPTSVTTSGPCARPGPPSPS